MRSGQTEYGKTEHRQPRDESTRVTGLGEFNSDDPYIYYCGQESLRRNGVAIMVNKRTEMQFLGASSKMTE